MYNLILVKLILLWSFIILAVGLYYNILQVTKYMILITVGYLITKNINKIIKLMKAKQNIINEYSDMQIKNLKYINHTNSVYLTNFRQNGLLLYLYNFLDGYYHYFFDFINFFCLGISFFQIYDYNDYRSFIPLSIFSTLFAVYNLYRVSKLISEQNKINDTNFKTGTLKDIKLGDVIVLKYGDIIPAVAAHPAGRKNNNPASDSARAHAARRRVRCRAPARCAIRSPAAAGLPTPRKTRVAY